MCGRSQLQVLIARTILRLDFVLAGSFTGMNRHKLSTDPAPSEYKKVSPAPGFRSEAQRG
jgi:hypothetical protein